MSSSDPAPDNSNLAQIPEVTSSLPAYTEKDYEKVSTASDYLCRIQLCGSNSKLTKQGKVGMGVYAYIISKDKVEDLGNRLPVLVLARRIKALRMQNGKVEIVSFDPASAIFQEIQKQAQKGALPENGPTVAMYGPEFLLWVPAAKGGNGACATYHLSNPTGRKQGSEFSSFVGKSATLTVQFIEPVGSKFSWHGPLIGECSKAFAQPDAEYLEKSLRQFLNPPKDMKVLAAAEGEVER